MSSRPFSVKTVWADDGRIVKELFCQDAEDPWSEALSSSISSEDYFFSEEPYCRDRSITAAELSRKTKEELYELAGS